MDARIKNLVEVWRNVDGSYGVDEDTMLYCAEELETLAYIMEAEEVLASMKSAKE